MYLELFEAVYRGDVETVKKLTIGNPVGKQAHVAAIANYSKRTPLHIAAEKNDWNLFSALVGIW